MKNHQDFTPNRMNKYSIRKLSIGTASLLVGSILVFGFSNDVQAAELKGGDVTKGIDEKINTDNEKENNEKNVATDNTLDNSSNKILNSKDDTSTNNTKTDLNNQSHDNNNYEITSDKVISSESESSFKENQLNDSTINKEIKNNQKQVDKKDEYQLDALNLRKNELNNNSKVQKSIIESTKVNDKNSENNFRRKNEFIAKETVDNRSSEENLSQNLKISERNVNNVSPENIKLSNKELINLNNKIAESRLYSPIGVRNNRDLTEDSSLEALDYSDNYTFQTLIFQPDALTTKKVLDGKSIPFQIHSYLTGANSGDRYKIDLQLDPVLANHVTKIKVNPAGRTSPVELVRLANKQGKLTNIWQINFIRANGGLFGGAEILSQYTADNGVIELDDTVRNILDGMKDHTDKLNYLIYVKDSLENKKIQTSETSGYFLTPSETLINNIVPSNSSFANSVFKGSSGSVQYDSTIGKFGGVTIDQQILKNGTFSYGGPIIDSGLNKQWRYHYQIDPTLIPFIGSIELHRYDFRGVGGFDKVYYEKNKVADLAIDKNGRGSISDSDLNKLIEFNNSLPETVGIRIVIKYNQSPNNILTRDAKYDENGNLIRSTTRIKEDFAFNGYFTDRNGGIIKNTFGSSTYYIQDLDQDGLTDNFEIHKSQSDPFNNDSDGDGKNDGDEVLRYETSPLVGKPMANDITTEDTAVEGKVQLDLFAPNQKVKILDENGTLISTGSLNDNGGFRVEIPKLKPGTYTIAIESPNYSNDEVNTFKVINIKEVLKPTIEPLNDQSTSIEVNGVEGSTIIIKDENDNVIGKTVLNKGETKKSIELKKPLKEGTILTAIAEKNGFISNKSNPVIVKDITAPEAPTMNDFTSNDKEITGEAEPGSTVEIVFQNGQKMSAQADDQGHFTVEVPAGVFNNGGQVTAKATDAAGNESAVTTKDVADETAPTAPIMDEFTSNDNQITGQAEPNSTVEVTFPDGQKVSVQADDQGHYTVKVPEKALNNGGQVSVKATDAAGNESAVTTKNVADETAPTAPTMDEFTSNDKQITGQAEPNSTVEVTFPDGQKVSVQADDQGRYTVDVPTNAMNNGGQVSVKATDAAGNESEVTTKNVADETAPTAPTMDEFTSNDKQITGQAEPGSTVEITFPDGQKVSSKADDQGHYTVKVPEKAL
uniref:Ig-like domain-containing protein n=1 Tax=Staphylococcus caeli TaxID=2201815 RepID=UPI003F5750E5